VSAAFLDTAGWLAALVHDQAHHRESAAAYQSLIAGGVPLVTTNLVMAEMQAMLMRRRGTPAALRFLDEVYSDPGHEVVFIDRDTERAAIDRWLRKFSDHDISLADATSFEVMRTRRIRDALTLDAHFRAAGFTIRPG
jgi:predicted nucleic acid-binding protein